MKRKKNFLLMKLTLLVIVSFMFGIDGQSQIVAYDLSSSNAATAGIAVNYPGRGRVMNISGITQYGGFSGTNGQTCYGWNNVGSDSWATSVFSTAGYINLSGSFQMKANTNIGPRDFKVQYSLNGSTWANAATESEFSLTNALVTYDFTLPAECDNKSTVYVRWVQNSAYQLNGVTPIGTTSTYNASLKGVSIAGDAFAAPSTQASNISIISVTPTTIKIGCTNGNGNNRIIVINNINSFTDPVNDYYPTANLNYGGTGEQVIYCGSGSSLTVNVPSSTNVYWFRVYEFNKMENLTRYKITTASSNPKQCKLEGIHSPTSANIGLINSTLGATIITPTTGSVVERGVFWSLTSPVDETSNLISELSNQGGVYSISEIAVDRGKTVYYKGYVTNESGTIMSEEASFSNVPTFTGTGTWETAALWNVQEVPGATGDPVYGSVEDSPIINGNCTLTASNNVTNLTIGGGKKLTINKAVEMKVDGTLVNNSGTPGILIKSADNKNDDSPNGTLIFGAGTPQATVEMFSKAEWNLSLAPRSKFKWQFFGIPVTALTYSNSFSGCYVREWDESVTDFYDVWVRRNNAASLQLSASSTLTAGLGYELVQENNKKYTFAGNLVRTNFSKTLPYTSTAYFKGQSILSNPYTAAMNISQLTFGANTVNAVYLYNTGTFNDWTVADGENVPGSGPGTYTVSTPGSVGLPGVPTQIPSMQAFLVKATANTGSVSYLYNNLMANAEMQRAKQVTSKTGMKIDLIGATYSDRMWILLDDNCTQAFDNGYDGPKMLGDESVSQLYGFGVDDIYQINAISDVNESYLGVKPGLDTQFKLVFNHQNIESKYAALYLIDLIDNKVVDITQDGTEYSFTSTSTDNEKRFKIVSTITNLEKPNGNSELLIYNSGNDIVVDNRSNQSGSLTVFDAMGRVVKTAEFGANKLFNLPANLSNGTYIIKAIVNSEKITKRIVIN